MQRVMLILYFLVLENQHKYVVRQNALSSPIRLQTIIVNLVKEENAKVYSVTVNDI